MNNLENLFEGVLDELTEMALAFPVEDKEKYCQLLSQKYYLVRNSTRYLALSASKVDVNDRAGFRYWTEHLTEELDHDQLILKDLKKLGHTDIHEMDPMVRAMILAQYQDIENNGANAILGYALMLEGLSCRVCNTLAERVEAVHGRGTTTYLRLHASVDEDHYPEGIEHIKKLDIKEQQIIAENLMMMKTLYISAIRNIVENSPIISDEKINAAMAIKSEQSSPAMTIN